MAKFDISAAANGIKTGDPLEAKVEPDRTRRGLRSDSIRMRGARVAMGPIHRGIHPQVGTAAILSYLLLSSTSGADPVALGPTGTAPDVPQRTSSPAVANAPLPPSWDLDGLYLWLGPTGAASREGAQWDSTFGGDATVIRVREHESLGAVGATLGAARWTVRGGGRIWLDALAGTPALGHMFGVSAGPFVELSDLHHPRLGGSLGVWAFVGVTPYARVGTVEGLGAFAEVGLHIALPVIRSRR
jgi:hypothetical protein